MTAPAQPQIIGNRCHVTGSGATRHVRPASIAQLTDGRFTSIEREGITYSGKNVHFQVIANRGQHQVIATPVGAVPLDESSQSRTLVYRDIDYYWVQEVRVDFGGGFGPSSSMFNMPTVGGAFPSIIVSAYFPDGSGAPDPALYGNVLVSPNWPITAYTDYPYYPTAGFFAEGFSPPYSFEDTPPDTIPFRQNIAIGAMFTTTSSDGGNDYEYDIIPVTVREYKWSDTDWPAHFGY